MRFLFILIVVVIHQTFAIDLHCEFTSLFRDGTLIRQCKGLDILITKRETITSINSQNNTPAVIPNVGHPNALFVEDQILHFFPRNLEPFFYMMNQICILTSKLRTIEKQDIKVFPFLMYLDLTGNDLIFLDGKTFESNLKLNHLNFENNKLKYIDPNVMEGLIDLEYCNFLNNECISRDGSTDLRWYVGDCGSPVLIKGIYCSEEIETVTEKLQKEMSELKIKYEKALAELETLRKSCDGNLNAATKNLFLSSKKSETKSSIEVNETSDKITLTCGEFQDKNTCNAVDLKVPFDSLAIEKVIDYRKTRMKSNKFSKLNVNVQQTLFLPLKIATAFPHLKELEVTSSGLFSIDSSNFEGMEKLLILNLSSNKIIELTSSTFKTLESLEILDLSFNNIEILEKGAFDHLKTLRSLSLNDNELSEIKAETLSNLMSLKILYLQNNKIKVIATDFLKIVGNFETINAVNNLCIGAKYPEHTLEEFTNEIVNYCIAPVDLSCSFETKGNFERSCSPLNLVVEYHPQNAILSEGFESKDNITELNILHQATKYIPSNLAKVLPRLNKLSIIKSNLTALKDLNFKNLTELQNIVVTHNNISIIEHKVFEDVPQLLLLDLTENNIQSLPSGVFVPLKKLKTLILSHNNLKHFTADFLPIRNSIEILRADNNQLEVIDVKILRYLRKSDEINLTGNSCIDAKFEKMDKEAKTIIEIYAEIDLSCSIDEVDYKEPEK